MWRLAISLCLSIWCAVWAVAQDDTRRIALLVANAAYDEAVGPLQNPENDVAALKASLIRAGFTDSDIRILPNAGERALHGAVRDFAADAKTLGEGDLAFFYYSGHGAKEPGRESTRLIPVDITDVSDTDFWFDTLDLSDDVIRVFTDAKSKAAWIVAIDACRNELRLPNRQLGGGEDKGFSAVPSSAGMLISFAADSGQTAKDNVGGSVLSPYAEALAEELTVPGRTLASIFERVRPRVIGATNGAQAPVYTNKLNVGGLTLISAAPIRSEEDVTWEFVQRIATTAAFQAYVDQYGDRGKYTGTARAQLVRLTVNVSPAPVQPDAPPIWKQFTEGDWSAGQYEVMLATVLAETDVEALRRAADAGDPDAATLLAWAYADGVGGLEQNYERAIPYYEMACDGGNLRACSGLGFRYRRGDGVSRDYGRARELYEQACEGGNALGCTNLGVLYDNGQGVEQDYARAVALYERACEGGNALGCNNLGALYADGQGVEREQTQARNLFQRACDGGDRNGCGSLGNYLRLGLGGPVDQERGEALLRQACADGNEWSCDRVAEFE